MHTSIHLTTDKQGLSQHTARLNFGRRSGKQVFAQIVVVLNVHTAHTSGTIGLPSPSVKNTTIWPDD